MSDRLQELLRQKALLSEHAAWLDREIALEQDRAGVLPSPAAAPDASAPLLEPLAAAPDAPASPLKPPVTAGDGADALLDQYRAEPQSIHQQVTRGCFLYFLGALVLVGMGVLAVYLLKYRHW